MDSLEEIEKKINTKFNDRSSEMLEDHLTQGIPESAIHQVNKMIEQDIDSAIDIGSGPGSVVFELAKHDLSKVIGIDLSDEMINISNRRLSEFDYDNVEFIQSSVLNFENQPIDGVSMHRMICCHPNKDEVIDKTLNLDPKVISLTIPRNRIFIKVYIKILSWYRRLFKRFHPYYYDPQDIIQQYRENDYKLIDTRTEMIWITLTFIKS